MCDHIRNLIKATKRWLNRPVCNDALANIQKINSFNNSCCSKVHENEPNKQFK